jgi:hypothetical protein
MLKCYISQIQIRKNIKSTAKLQERSHNSQHKDTGRLSEGGGEPNGTDWKPSYRKGESMMVYNFSLK